MPETSKNPGLLHACLLNKNGGARFVTDDSWRSWKKEDGIAWLHFDYTVDEAQNWLMDESGIVAPVVLALIEPSSRPRVSSVGNNLLVILRGVNHNPGAEPEDMVAMRLWLEESRIVTTRKRDMLSVSDIITKLALNKGPVSTGDFLATLCEGMIFRMGDTIDETEDMIAMIETQSFEENNPQLRFEISELRRQIIVIRRFLSPQREALHKLPYEPCTWIDDSVRLRLREATDRLIHHIEDLDAVRERAAIVQEEINSRTNEQVNKRMYMLSLVTVVFMPLTFMTGLLGVNLGGIPGGTHSLGFTIFVVSLLVLGALEFWFLRIKRWF
ncbi:MAG: zinc transporter ZntB [Spirochaetia bacterium]|nr:zinc transporter ZntB [Spirochaetia bacterium]